MSKCNSSIVVGYVYEIPRGIVKRDHTGRQPVAVGERETHVDF